MAPTGFEVARGSTSRARARNPSTVLDSSVAHAGLLAPRAEVGEALAVLGRRAVQRPVDGVPAQEQVQVVLEGDADAAVDLHAVLEQLGAVRRRCRPSPRSPARRRRRRPAATAAAASSVMAWLASSQRLHVGEAVLDRLVRGQRAAERVAVERPLDGHVERRPASRRPTRRWRARGPAGAAARPASAALPTSPTTASAGTRTSSKVTTENRRVRSTVLHRRDRDARRVGGDEHLGEPVAGAPGHEQVARPGRPTRPGASRRRARRRRRRPAPRGATSPRPVVRRGLGRGTRWRSPCPASRLGEHVGLASPPTSLSAAATTLVGTSGPGAAWRPNSSATRVRSTRPGVADAAAAVLLVDEQRRPAELGAPAPVLGVEAGRVVAEAAQLADGHLVVEEPRGRLAEELLVRAQLEQHSTKPRRGAGGVPSERLGGWSCSCSTRWGRCSEAWCPLTWASSAVDTTGTASRCGSARRSPAGSTTRLR